MKHLISLSLKYIRRQKLRSVLTFLCITLSVFLIGTASAYFGSIIQTFKNQVIAEDGSWEVDLSRILNNENIVSTPDDIKNDLDIISKHVTVSDYYTFYMESLDSEYDEDSQTKLIYSLNINGKDTKFVESLSLSENSGNPELVQTEMDARSGYYYNVPTFNEGTDMIAPSWMHDELGYNVGDTVTITFTPMLYTLDLNDAEIQRAISEVSELNDDTYHYISGINEPTPEEEESLGYKSFSGHFMMEYIDYSKLTPVSLKKGEPITETFTISKFKKAENLDKYGQTFSVTLSPERSFFIYKFAEKNSELLSGAFNNWTSVYTRMNDKIDFDDAVLELLNAIGLDESDFLIYFDTTSMYNNELLALELKSADAIATLIPIIVIGLLIALIAWGISRFIIDNAFEISVQERSTQFATLRIMGASRQQIVTLILTEAIFYMITSVPIGIICAFLACKKAMTMLHDAGLKTYEFHANIPIAVVGTLLCIAAIFISALTSAMWAARKLTPAEALNFGKPRSKKKLKKAKRSKGFIGSRKFMFYYTMKNITSRKNSFIISSIALGLGVLLFNICMMTMIIVIPPINKQLDRDGFDIRVEVYDSELIPEFENLLGDKNLFAEYRFRCYTHTKGPEVYEDIKPLIDSAQINPYNDFATSICSIGRRDYDKYVYPVTGITYDNFSGQRLGFYMDSYYEFDEETYIIDSEKKKDPYFKPTTDYGISQPLKILDDEFTAAGVLLCDLGAVSDFCFVVSNEAFIDTIEVSAISGSMEYRITVKDVEAYDDAYDAVVRLCSDNYAYIEDASPMMFTGLKQFIRSVLIVAAIVILTIWLIGIFSMTNTINTSVLNRRQELVMMRAVGMTKKQLYGTVILQSILFSLFPCIFGTLLGTGAVAAVAGSAQFGMGFVEVIASCVGELALSLIINVIIAVLSSIPAISSLSKRFK